MKLRWYQQAFLLLAAAVAVIVIFGESSDEPAVNKSEQAVSIDKLVVTIAPKAYTVVEAKRAFVGWHRVTLEIEAGSAVTPRQQVETMMRAAVTHFPLHNVDVMSVRLWEDYSSDTIARNRLVYAPDGCGWVRGSSASCDKPIWTDLLRGEFPAELLDWNG